MTQVYAPDVAVREPWLLHRGLLPMGACLLMAVFVTDLAYWRTALFQWNNFSGWLLFAGLIMAGLSAIAFLVDVVLGRVRPISWPRFLGVAVAALLSLLNAFVHSRDAYTAVVPEGVILSGIVTAILIVVGISGGWDLRAYRLATLPSQARRVQS